MEKESNPCLLKSTEKVTGLQRLKQSRAAKIKHPSLGFNVITTIPSDSVESKVVIYLTISWI